MAAEKDLKSILGKLQYSDDAKVVAQITDQMKQVQARMAGIKHKLVVMSGKGGVGKSMTTVNLALALARQHARVGLLDVDLNGPCVPRMLGLHGRSLTMTPDGAVPPVGPLGVKVASMDFFLGAASPVRWKGPMDVSPVWLGLMEMNVIREFLADVVWGELDYLLADLPPGAAADKPPGDRRLHPRFGRCDRCDDAFRSRLRCRAEIRDVRPRHGHQGVGDRRKHERVPVPLVR